MNCRILIVLIFSTIFIKEAWIYIAENPETFDPFPYYDIQITRQTYIAYACLNAMMLLFAYTLGLLVNKYNEVIRLWFYIQFAEFIDYFFTYNQPWFDIPFTNIHVGITFVKFTALSIMIIYKFKPWKE